MSRSRVDRDQRRSSHHANKYVGDNNKREALLRNYGISVFRELNGSELDDCREVFRKHTGGVLSMSRNEADQKGLSLNVVALVEVARRQQFGSVTVKHAIDQIYDRVPSLRRPLDLRVDSAGFFGSPEKPVRPVAVVVAEEDRQKFIDERQAVLDVLEDIAEDPFEPESWAPKIRPHISLGKISVSGLSDLDRRDLIRELNEDLPQIVHLDRATIYNPTA